MIGWVSQRQAQRNCPDGTDSVAHADPTCGCAHGADLVPVSLTGALKGLPFCRYCRPPEGPGDWADKAACKGAPSDWFFGTEAGGGVAVYRQARDICERCPVIDDCLAFALRTRMEYGMWAGTTPLDRQRILSGGAT